jgi:hypothetical protein
MEVCEKCGVPLGVSSSLRWESNGVISMANSPSNRMVFFESETLDGVFKGIERLIGAPIEHIVIESRRRETRRFIERTFSPEVRGATALIVEADSGAGPAMALQERAVQLAVAKSVMLSINEFGMVYGYGDFGVGGTWITDDDYPWRTQSVKHPYSVPFMAADNLGSVEACEGTDMRVEYRETEKDTYEIKVLPGEHPIALQGRLRRTRYDFKPGDIVFERCPLCKVPLGIAQRKWGQLGAGTIVDPLTGRRMAIFGPIGVDSIFDDLKSELGDAIEDTIIEAVRRYIKVAWGHDEWKQTGADFQHLVSLRGAGNITGFDGDKSHLSITIENACFHLPLVGTAQGLVELVYGVDSSTREWELSDDGVLKMNIIVR